MSPQLSREMNPCKTGHKRYAMSTQWLLQDAGVKLQDRMGLLPTNESREGTPKEEDFELIHNSIGSVRKEGVGGVWGHWEPQPLIGNLRCI